MNFGEAFKLMLQGHRVKLSTWTGWWYWDSEKETVMMHCRDGQILDIRETQDVKYTLNNITRNDWEVVR
jgi:hypothetical protein